jgi:hypothetical protein
MAMGTAMHGDVNPATTTQNLEKTLHGEASGVGVPAAEDPLRRPESFTDYWLNASCEGMRRSGEE